MLNTAAFAPMPSPRVGAIVTVKSGLFTSMRKAYFRFRRSHYEDRMRSVRVQG